MKIISIIVVGIFILSGFGAVAQYSDDKEIENVENEKLDFTHGVIAEYGTATWCGYCHYAHTALKNIYASGDYPFYFVSFVSDKNGAVCNPRLQTELNLYGYPTAYFDGGAGVYCGGGSGNENAYRSIISTTGARTVYDVDIVLDVTWLGGTEMQIDASVQNNEASTYDGTIRVYITEIISSMNWKDTSGKLYTFPLLDYAFKTDGTGEIISIPAGGTWSSSTTWDGSDHGFNSITEDNIMIIAAVFNDDWHQGYAYPPNQNPFNAYYVDDTVAFRVGNNRPPDEPSNPNPADGSTDVDQEKDLSWTGGDPDWFDTVTYDVYFGTTNPPPIVSNGQSSTNYNPGTLILEETYYWKIISWDNNGASTSGPVWSFTIRGNTAPDDPEIDGPTEGIAGEEYTYEIFSTDPEGDDIIYCVDFGDDTGEVCVGPFPSGTIASLDHTWTEEGTYSFKAKATDIFGAESDWVTLEVVMPVNQNVLSNWLLQFLQNHPQMFPILRYIFGL